MRRFFFFLFGFVLLLSACTTKQHQASEKTSEFVDTDEFSEFRMAIRNEEVDRQRFEAKGEEFAIATQGVHSSAAAEQMFEQGGNVIDAVVAASFTISVERPQSTGIGGGGFLVFHDADTDETVAIDFRERAPQRSYSEMYLDMEGQSVAGLSKDGILASGVPGLVAGLLEIHERYGSLPRDKVMAPAIELAREGFEVYEHLARAISARQEVLERFPASRQLFLDEKGLPLEKGDWLIQQDLAETLAAIAQNGRDGFYKGWVANAILSEMQRLGGLIEREDLNIYDVKYREPVKGTFDDFEIYSMPPPSSGGVHILQILNTVEPLDLKEAGVLSPYSVHWTSAAMQLAFADRAHFLGDPDFVEVPTEKLISKEYAKRRRDQISPDRAMQVEEVSHGDVSSLISSDETTHLTIADADGNIATTTQTINGWMGSGVVVPGTGIVMNNEMNDFAVAVGEANMYGAIGGKPNQIEPQKTPLSSMSPTIVMREGRPVLSLGTPAGTRILTCVAQTILNHLEFELPLWESVSAVRFHHQWQPDHIRVDEAGLSERSSAKLLDLGYNIEANDLACRVQAISLKNGILNSVSDPRGEGKAIAR